MVAPFIVYSVPSKVTDVVPVLPIVAPSDPLAGSPSPICSIAIVPAPLALTVNVPIAVVEPIIPLTSTAPLPDERVRF